MNYYKRHIGDYVRDTSHLSLLEHGIYAKLLDVYYVREAPIPDDEAERLIGARSTAEKKATRAVLKEFFRLHDGAWHQARCDAEIAAYQAKADRNREAGKQGGRPRKPETEMGADTKPNGNPNGFQTVSETEPIGNPEETLANSHKPEKNSVRAAAPPPGSLATEIYRLGRSLGIDGGVIRPEIDRCGEDAVWRALGKTLEARPAENLPYFRGCLKAKERRFQA